MRSIILVLVLAVAAAAVAANLFLGDLAEDEAMREDRIFREQVAGYEEAANAGNPKAQVALADVYLSAPRELRDPDAAIALLRSAAGKGDIEAQYRLGRLLETGVAGEVDYAAAAEWYRKAVRVGEHPQAQLALGMMYFRGRGVGQNEILAARWISRAAENNQPVAQYLMGRLYENGFSVRRDPIEAYKWYALSARLQDQVEAYDPRYKPDRALRQLSSEMNQSQIDAAKEAVANWRPAP